MKKPTQFKFHTKLFSPYFWKESFAKIMVNVQKRLKGASAKANFWHGENIEHVEKKDLLEHSH